jgi:hypothetical protein
MHTRMSVVTKGVIISIRGKDFVLVYIGQTGRKEKVRVGKKGVWLLCHRSINEVKTTVNI